MDRPQNMTECRPARLQDKPGRNNPSVSVIVSTYNNVSGLESCLLGLQRQVVPADRIVVADDGSAEPTRKVVERFARSLPITHVWQPDDGFRLSEIRNRAAARSGEDYLVFLDGDCIPHPRFVADHRDFARVGTIMLAQRCAILGFHGKILPRSPSLPGLCALLARKRLLSDGPRFGTGWKRAIRGLLKGIRLPRPIYRTCTEFETRGGNLGVWRADFLRVNGFDESFKGWGFEDIDFSRRVIRLGVEAKLLIGGAVCYHIDHPFNTANTANADLVNSERPIRCTEGVDKYLMPA
jgi:glycosyltransferase involved in cell wall biosynthesis